MVGHPCPQLCLRASAFDTGYTSLDLHNYGSHSWGTSNLLDASCQAHHLQQLEERNQWVVVEHSQALEFGSGCKQGGWHNCGYCKKGTSSPQDGHCLILGSSSPSPPPPPLPPGPSGPSGLIGLTGLTGPFPTHPDFPDSYHPFPTQPWKPAVARVGDCHVMVAFGNDCKQSEKHS